MLIFYYNLLSVDQSPNTITDYIVTESLVNGVDPQLILNTAKFESRLNPHAVGDHNTSFGLYQIHLPAHSEISRAQAEDIVWSTQWTINEMRKNGCRIWSTCSNTMKTLSIRDD